MNKKSYVIGGYVRDFIIEKNVCKKVYIVTVGDCIKLAKKVCEKLDHKHKINIFKYFGTAIIKYNNLNIEFLSTKKRCSLKEFKKKIDFTINTLAISLNNLNYGKLIDPFGGLFYIIKNKIKYDEYDSLRMIRAIRFYNEFNKILSIERIKYEFNKILLSNKPSTGILFLYKIGLLSIILPELINLKGIENKNKFKHKDNFLHTLEVVDNISIYTNNIWLIWAALLHDIGKYLTKKYIPNFGWTFHSHELIGSKMIILIFERLKLPKKKYIKYVKKIIKYSSRPITLISYTATDSSIRRLLFDIGSDIEDLILMCKSDITTKNYIKKIQFKINFNLLKLKLKKVEEKDKKTKAPIPISGYQIMNIFGINPCKEIGIIKNILKYAIMNGIIPFEKANIFIIKIGKKILDFKSTVSERYFIN